MTTADLEAKLRELRSLPGETEWVEFKHNYADAHDIGDYLSALSNSAALHRQPFGYLVWGIQNETHSVIGTGFQPRKAKGKGNEDLEPWLSRLLSPRADFHIHEFQSDGKPVVLFQVQAARNSPVAFSGADFIRIGSHKKSLREYPEKERALWQILSGEDWSDALCDGATVADLDPDALRFARAQYKLKNESKPILLAEVDSWDDRVFLQKMKVAHDGKLKRAAILLLGRPESVHFIAPAIAPVTWILKDASGSEQDYAHFGPPFILNVDAVFKKVRNLTLRTMSGGTLFPKEIIKYDDWVFREALHNSIAHQDYTLHGRINLIEQDDSLLFSNLGSFIPGTLENVIERDAPEETYRNPCLAQAMVTMNMIDTIGSGIRRMFRKQQERFLPMPDYDLSDPHRVKVRVIGKILDERFTQILIGNTDLRLSDILWLDKVQKKRQIPDSAFKALKQMGLVEGRKSAPFISASVAEATGQEAEYIHNRGIEKDDCKQKVIDYLVQFGVATRKKFHELIIPLLSAALDERQKRTYVKNLLQEMKRADVISIASGSRSNAVWVLSQGAQKHSS
jgi:ATP-dependent DNA helicase RecG